VLRAGVRVGAGQARTRAACGVLGRSVGRAGEVGAGAGLERIGPRVEEWCARGLKVACGLGRPGREREEWAWAEVLGSFLFLILFPLSSISNSNKF
jgi:hypothetical protein